MLCRNCPRSKHWRPTCASARVGRVIERADVAEFSVLKTYDPPLSALAGAHDHRGGPARQVPRPERQPAGRRR